MAVVAHYSKMRSALL